MDETVAPPEERSGRRRWDQGKEKTVHPAAPGGFGYMLGVIGAAVYYIQASSGFWGGVVGFLKALVWPAFLVYEVLRFLLG